jgi:MarR family transcriptional regulator, organic hydroperoxide resistance regulator
MERNKKMKSLDIDSFYELICCFEPGSLLADYESKLSINELKALRVINDNTPHCPVQIIGRSLNITKSGATRFITRLENYGLIKKCFSPKDGRVCCIILTDEGSKVNRGASDYSKRKINKILAGLSNEAKLCLNKYLPEVLKNINNFKIKNEF